MRSLDVIVFCSIAARVKHIHHRLRVAGLNNVKVISGAGEQYAMDLSTLTVDLVICDSFGSHDEIYFFRILCEICNFFSILKSDELEPCIRWGISSFLAKARKYNAGDFSTGLGQAAFNSLLLKVETAKMCVNDHSRSSPVQQMHVSHDNTENLCGKTVIQALEAQYILPYYQPKICLKTHRILGVEVLARWQHSEQGLLLPALFLEVIEQDKLHTQLFECLLEQGLKLHKYLYSIGESLIFAYNIEASQLKVEGFASNLIKQVRKVGLPARFITLEITEKQPLTLDMASIDNITTLVRSGVGLSLDDFGSGFSSIARLAQLPFNQIKLDAGFVAQSLGFKESRIIESIVSLASSLNLEVVAEGVETDKQRKHLIEMGIDAAQGYLFHKPMDGAALVKVLVADSTRHNL